MITDGWILPDGSEIVCDRMASDKWYLTAINKYLIYLKREEPIYYKIININMVMFSFKVSYFSLEDFAVFVLGWVKVGSFPYRHIQTAGYEFQKNLRDKYVSYGFIDTPPSIIFPESRFLKINVEVDTSALA